MVIVLARLRPAAERIEAVPQLAKKLERSVMLIASVSMGGPRRLHAAVVQPVF